MMLRGGHLGVSYNKNSVTAEEAESYEAFGSLSLQARLATLIGTCQRWA